MSLTRYEGGGLVDDGRYLDRLPIMAKQLASSSMCPETWRIKPGDPEHVKEQKIADLSIIGYSLAELDLRLTVNTLPECYVVHGRPAFMAQLQIALAARHGCKIVPLDEESDATSATVKVLGKDGEWHHVTVTYADAMKAGWVGRNQNYKSMPDRMLMARAVTKAIAQHCPEAKFALPAGNQSEFSEADWAEPTAPPAAEAEPDLITSPQAKKLLIEACSGDIAKATELWADRGKNPISTDDLAVLIASSGVLEDEIVDAEVVDEAQPEYGPDEEPFD